MKYLKYFENNSHDPQIGDYVVCYEENEIAKSNKDIPGFLNFLSNNVGRYIDVFNNVVYPYEIQYENIPTHLQEIYFDLGTDNIGTRQFSREQILFHSKNKEKVETYIQAKKYNL